MRLHLISHPLCPYVQRAVIALTEKAVPFTRTDIDLGNKPDWFLALSPLGKTPVLAVDGVPVFESAVILEYLEETEAKPLHPTDALVRARHRGWIEFASAILNDIAGFYAAPDRAAFEGKAAALEAKFARLEAELGARTDTGPWFAPTGFSLVDAAFAPVFRYFDTFDRVADFGILAGKPALAAWRQALAARPSVIAAVSPDYAALLTAFLKRKGAYLSTLL